VNRIVFLISLPKCSLIVYRKATKVCMLIFVFWYFAESFYQIQQLSNRVFGSFMYMGISCTNRDNLIFLPIWIPFISFPCLNALAKNSGTILNNSGESEHFCLIPDFRENASSFSPFNTCCLYVCYILYYVDIYPFFS
jgi:hypothetical protein